MNTAENINTTGITMDRKFELFCGIETSLRGMIFKKYGNFTDEIMDGVRENFLRLYKNDQGFGGAKRYAIKTVIGIAAGLFSTIKNRIKTPDKIQHECPSCFVDLTLISTNEARCDNPKCDMFNINFHVEKEQQYYTVSSDDIETEGKIDQIDFNNWMVESKGVLIDLMSTINQGMEDDLFTAREKIFLNLFMTGHTLQEIKKVIGRDEKVVRRIKTGTFAKICKLMDVEPITEQLQPELEPEIISLENLEEEEMAEEKILLQKPENLEEECLDFDGVKLIKALNNSEAISDREYEVLMLVLHQYSDMEISEEMGVGQRAVSRARRAVFNRGKPVLHLFTPGPVQWQQLELYPGPLQFI